MSSPDGMRAAPHGAARGVLLLRIVLFAALAAGSALQFRIGLADNGDFSRLMTWVSSGPAGFTPGWPAEGTEEYRLRFWNHSIAQWRLDLPLRSRWVSSVLLLWAPGVALNAALISPHMLWLPMLSLGARACMLAFLLVLFRWIDRALPGRRMPATLLLGVPFVLHASATDTLAYFTSFYQEPAVLVSVFVLLGVLWHVLRRPASVRGAVLVGLAVMLLGTSKISNLYWPVVVFLFVMPWGAARRSRSIAAAYTLCVLVVPVAFTLLQASLVGSRRDNAYQSIWCGALTFSTHPGEHLARLGITDGGDLIREPAYTPRARAFIAAHADAMSHAHTLGIIAREPEIARRMCAFAADSMQRMTLTHLGTSVLVNDTGDAAHWRIEHPRGAGRASFANAWSLLKARTFPRGRALLLSLAALALLFAAAMRSKLRTRALLARLGLLAVLTCALDMWLQVFGDGRQDLIKHLFLANLLFDLALVLLLAVLLAGRGAVHRIAVPGGADDEA